MRYWCVGVVFAIASCAFCTQAQVTNSNQLGTTGVNLSQSNAASGALLQTNRPTTPASESVDDPRSSRFWLHTLVTIGISALTAWITTIFSDRKKRKELLRQEFAICIKGIRSFCEEISAQIITHLVAQPFSASTQKGTQISILAKMKLCGDRIQSAGAFLHKPAADCLEKEFLKWKGELTGSPFPVSTKGCAVPPHDPAISKVQLAGQNWNKYLDGLSLSCFNGSLEVPLHPRA